MKIETLQRCGCGGVVSIRAAGLWGYTASCQHSMRCARAVSAKSRAETVRLWNAAMRALKRSPKRGNKAKT